MNLYTSFNSIFMIIDKIFTFKCKLFYVKFYFLRNRLSLRLLIVPYNLELKWYVLSHLEIVKDVTKEILRRIMIQTR